MASLPDPKCPTCGHLGSYHDMPRRGGCVGKVGAALDLGTKACDCARRPEQIPGWDAFKGPRA